MSAVDRHAAAHVARLERRLAELEAENARLRTALDRPDGGEDERSTGRDRSVATVASARDSPVAPDADTPPVALSPIDKIALFRSRFAGRDDLYAQRWESGDGSRKGYAPVCTNEWRAGVCEKPRVKCHECRHRAFEPVTDAVLRDHLTGVRTVGRYALDAASRCRFVVADFDRDGWREDIVALARTCRRLDVPALVEISRSGNGAHLWLFLDAPVPAARARRLATALIERTCREERLLALSSHDRLIPGQDVLSGAGFGSLVALPLQKAPRERGASVFVDDALDPFDDQWAALQAAVPIEASTLDALVDRIEDGHPGVSALPTDPASDAAPWSARRRRGSPTAIPSADMPPVVRVTLADGVYVERGDLPQPAVHAIARLAAFANPLWHERVRTNRSTWDVTRFVERARALPRHVLVPRGCLAPVIELLEGAGTRVELVDERVRGRSIPLRFEGTLRADQRAAVAALAAHDTGVLHAPPGFGKTVTAAYLIARRACPALVIVHTTALLAQWRASLARFLGRPAREIGRYGGPGKRRMTGEIDVAGVQALARLDDGELAGLLDGYGQVIVDECHHAGSASCSRVLDAARSRYVTGLSATPERRDGLEPLVYMLCGPVRHKAAVSREAPVDLAIEALEWNRMPDVADDVPVQTLLSAVAEDAERTAFVARAAAAAWCRGRKVLLLTERRAHVDALVAALATATSGNDPEAAAPDATGPVPASGLVPIVLHGQLSRRARADAFARLDALDPGAPRCIVATGRLVGEGFDHPALDTLVFGMPFAWRGTLAQYVGRLARPSPGKHDARVVDVRDTGHPVLESMWRKRAAGYRALGWREHDGRSLF